VFQTLLCSIRDEEVASFVEINVFLVPVIVLYKKNSLVACMRFGDSAWIELLLDLLPDFDTRANGRQKRRLFLWQLLVKLFFGLLLSTPF